MVAEWRIDFYSAHGPPIGPKTMDPPPPSPTAGSLATRDIGPRSTEQRRLLAGKVTGKQPPRGRDQHRAYMDFNRANLHQDDPEYGDPDTFYSIFHDRMPCGDAHGLAKYAHRAMERPYKESYNFTDVIEVGAGAGNHFAFVRHTFRRYVLTDLREGLAEAAKASLAGDPRVTCSVADAQDLHYRDRSFDRLIATCLLIHLPHPENALREWRRVVRANGVVTIYVPNEGAFLHFARRLTTARAASRLGYRGYDLMLAREHINRNQALDLLIRHNFRKDRLIRTAWPFHSSLPAAKLFTVYQAKILT